MLDLAYLATLRETYPLAYEAQPAPFTLRGTEFPHHPAPSLMGVVNLSRDSWYRESVVMNPEAAIRRGKRLALEGAKLIDLGAESTVLDAERVGEEDQIQRVLPVIEALSVSGILVSLETYSIEVAKRGLEAGAAVLNLTAGADRRPFYELAAAHEAGVIICYVAGDHVREVETLVMVEDHVGRLVDAFAQEVENAVQAGVKALWLDPGLGFYYKNLQDSAERVQYQMNAFLQGFRIRELGWPTCQALPHAFEFFEDEVRCAEPFFAVMSGLGKTDLIRTHEVSRVHGVLRTMECFDGGEG